MFEPTIIKQLKEIATAAGAIIMGFYNSSTSVEIKDDNSPVTEADIEASEFIVKKLQRITPEVPVISEESKDIPSSMKARKFWLVDPLDGTKSFIKRTGEFTVNIALVENGVPVFGVIYIPVTGVIYFTGEDKKAYRQKGKNSAPEQINTRKPPADGLVVVASQSHRTPETDEFINKLPKVKSLISSSSSIKLCLLAEGTADVYPRFGKTSEWDIAAGHAILNAAGGRLVTDKCEPFLYGKPNFLNGYFVAWGN